MSTHRSKKTTVKHIYSLMFETILFGTDERFSCINIVANIRLAKLPGGVVSLGYFFSFQADSSFQFSLSVEDPNKKEILRTADHPVPKHKMSAKNPNAVKTSQLGIVLGPITFESEGIYHIVWRADGRVAHREPFGVYIDPELAKEVQNVADEPGVNTHRPARPAKEAARKQRVSKQS